MRFLGSIPKLLTTIASIATIITAIFALGGFAWLQREIPFLPHQVSTSNASLDYSSSLNDPSGNYWLRQGAKLATPFHKTTCYNRECYDGSLNNGGLNMTVQIYPMASVSEAADWANLLVDMIFKHEGWTTVNMTHSTAYGQNYFFWAGNPPGNPPPPNVAAGATVTAYQEVGWGGVPCVSVYKMNWMSPPK